MALRMFKFRTVLRSLSMRRQRQCFSGPLSILVSRKFSSETRSLQSFDEMIDMRRGQAQRSVLVQVYSGNSYSDLSELCHEFGKVKETFYYTTNEELHFMLVEFESKESARKMMNSATFGQQMPAVPCVTPFLWMRANNIKKAGKGTLCPEPVSDSEAKPEEILQQMRSAQSISHQISVLRNLTKMADVGTRLRFLTARQLEMSLSGAFPLIKALPFGSSVNGFGKAGCDLDLVLQLGGLEEGQEIKSQGGRLVYHGKNNQSCNGRALVQRHMEVIADFIQHMLPGFSKIQRILHARVPIIKFRHDLTMVECDLSMTNMTALYMSELLYLMGEIDSRVRPLVCFVRKWAQSNGLTNQTPGRWISNFSLTLLTIFYLQKKMVLPSLGTLIHLAGPNDKRMTADGINCTFLRDLSNLSISKNEETLAELLAGFFDFYAGFDFASKGLSLVSGKEMPKPEHCPLYIENPMERYLNVSKNVSPEETVRLQVELRNSSWLLEQIQDEEQNGRESENWGVLKLLLKSDTSGFKVPKPKTFRLVQVKDLFSEQEDGFSQPRPFLRDVNKSKPKRR